MREFIIGWLIGSVISYVALRAYLADTVRECLSYTTFKTPCEVLNDMQKSTYFWNGFPVQALSILVLYQLEVGARKKMYVRRQVTGKKCHCYFEYSLAFNIRRRRKKPMLKSPDWALLPGPVRI